MEVLNGAAAAAIYGSRANAGVVQIFTKRGSSGAPVVSFTTNFMSSKLRKSVEVNQSPIKFGGLQTDHLLKHKIFLHWHGQIQPQLLVMIIMIIFFILV